MEETQPRAKAQRPKIVEFVLFFAVAALGAAALRPAVSRSRSNAERLSCQSNLKQIGLALKQYIRDYDETLPPLATSRREFGWAGALQPYLRSPALFQCLSETNSSNPDPAQVGYSDYWFNARMGSLPEIYLVDQANTIALSDGNSGNARSHLWAMPKSWQNNPKSPLYRHLNGANFAFADGHVKWSKATKCKNELDMFDGGKGPTFRIQLPVKPKH